MARVPARGIVSLVGAGPGDPDLITVRGLRRLRRAEVLVYDRLVHPALVDLAPPGADRVYVGKAAGGRGPTQAEINELLVGRARAGLRVVRLKGGDPFVFGRGGEEAAACAAAGVAWEVVPGLTSAVAAPAAAGIPLTRRGVASSFAVVSGHAAAASGGPGWRGLAGVDTLVVVMAASRLAEVASSLIAAGRAPGTPVAVVERASLPDQRVVEGTLADIARLAADAAVRPPAAVVVGEVVRLRELLAEGEGPPSAPFAAAVGAIRDAI